MSSAPDRLTAVPPVKTLVVPILVVSTLLFYYLSEVGVKSSDLVTPAGIDCLPSS